MPSLKILTAEMTWGAVSSAGIVPKYSFTSLGIAFWEHWQSMFFPRDKISVTTIKIGLHKDIDAPIVDLHPLGIERSDSRRPSVFRNVNPALRVFDGIICQQ